MYVEVISSAVKETAKHQLIRAIHTRRKLRIRFFSKEVGTYITRICAPVDYGPSRTAQDYRNKLHVWDYESDPHLLVLDQSHIEELYVLEQAFDPAEFVTWDTKATPWLVKRDWGAHS